MSNAAAEAGATFYSIDMVTEYGVANSPLREGDSGASWSRIQKMYRWSTDSQEGWHSLGKFVEALNSREKMRSLK